MLHNTVDVVDGPADNCAENVVDDNVGVLGVTIAVPPVKYHVYVNGPVPPCILSENRDDVSVDTELGTIVLT
jgi:hypothetical protein